MRRFCILLTMMVVLGACGDPLAGVARYSEVEIVVDGPISQALPTEQEIAREGFFESAVAAASVSPLAPAPKPSLAPQPRRVSLLGRLRRSIPIMQPTTQVDDLSPVQEGGALSTENTVPTAIVVDEKIPGTQISDEQPQLVSLSSELVRTPRRRGLLGRLTARDAAKSKGAAGIDVQEVPYGTVLPFGSVARVCDARRRPLGRPVESALASGYKLYDSAPNSTGVRTFYITGFDDDCPRQLTAAHVLLGEPSFYEELHYGPAGKHLTLGATDKAYEKVKLKVCGVRQGKPCGAKMRQLEKGTLFVNSYERIDDNTRWSEFLLHDSAVIESALKDNS